MAIAKNIDQNVPHGSNWHQALLRQMLNNNEKRKPVISDKLKDKLVDYLGFRHFYRHSYSFHLDWNEIGSLVISLEETWQCLKKEINSFMENNS